jgi:hypothetical protein
MPDVKVGSSRTYYGCGDMIIVYLSSVAPDYRMAIQTAGMSTGGQPAVDVGIRLNLTYQDARYAVNHVTLLDAGTNCRSYKDYSESIAAFVASSVDGEQCWLDNYVSKHADFYPNVLNVGFDTVDHTLALLWYESSWTNAESNKFNNGVVAGGYWSVIGPGKNLQLTSTQDAQMYKFKWYGSTISGYMDYYDESNHPGRLLAPVTLVGPEDGAYVDANGAVFSCEISENAVGYQLLFGSEPYRVMDYMIVSDTPVPPSEVITSFPYEQTWWTVQVYDAFGSTIYADPVCVYPEKVDVLEFGLIAHWKLDETEGIIAHDSVGNNDANLFGDPIWQPNGGILNGALAFDGIDDIVITPLQPPLGNSPRTIVLWAKTTESFKDMTGASYGGPPEGHGVAFNANFNIGGGDYGYEGVTIDTAWSAITYSAIISDDMWHFYTWVVPVGATKTEDVKVYMDGVLLTEIAWSFNASTPINTIMDRLFELGAWSSHTYRFYGILDEVCVYDRALSDNEIDALFNGESDKPNI